MGEKTYAPGEVIEKVGKGLNRDNLAYFVREGYIAPKKAQRGNQVYEQYSDNVIKLRFFEQIQHSLQLCFRFTKHGYKPCWIG